MNVYILDLEYIYTLFRNTVMNVYILFFAFLFFLLVDSTYAYLHFSNFCLSVSYTHAYVLSVCVIHACVRLHTALSPLTFFFLFPFFFFSHSVDALTLIRLFFHIHNVFLFFALIHFFVFTPS